MAVQIKSLETKDKFSSAKKSTVHYVKITKSNKKGAAAAIGGTLHEHAGHKAGDFHIELKTVRNDRPAVFHVEAGQIVFRTGTSKRWQVGDAQTLAKRFPGVKFV